MVRTQIQLPDDIYRKAKELSARKELSLAELTRRGLEYMIEVYNEELVDQVWEMPQPQKRGFKHISDEELKRQAQRSSFESELEAGN